MPNFTDFLQAVTIKGASNIKVDDILRSQSRGGVSGADLNESSKYLKDVAEMFISAEKQVDEEMKIFGNKEVVQELGKLSKLFTNYADNVTMMKFYLGKFSSDNSEMNKDDAKKLQELVEQNSIIVSSLNNLRTQDKDFNQKVQQSERKNDFHMRTQSVMQVEQERIQKKYNITSTELWKDINDELNQFKEKFKDDVKNGLIEGVGGPIGVLIRKVFAPGFKAIKDSTIGKTLGPKLEKLGATVKGLFIKDNNDKEDFDKVISEQIAGSMVQDDVVSSLDDLSIESERLGVGIDKGFSASIKDVIVPNTSLAKKKVLLEENARKVYKQKEQGVFRKILDSNEKGNILLKDITSLLKHEKSQLDESYTVLSEVLAVNTEMINGDNNKELSNSLEEQTIMLNKVYDNGVVQNMKSNVIASLNDEMFKYDKAMDEESDDDRGEDLKVQAKVLNELEDLNKKDFGKGLAGSLGMLATRLGALGATVGGMVVAGKLVKDAKEAREERQAGTLYDASRKEKKELDRLMELQPQLFYTDEEGYKRINKEELDKFVKGREAAIKAGTAKEQGYNDLSVLTEWKKGEGSTVSDFKVQRMEEFLLRKDVEKAAGRADWSGEQVKEKMVEAAESFRQSTGYGDRDTETEYYLEKIRLENEYNNSKKVLEEQKKVNADTKNIYNEEYNNVNTTVPIQENELDKEMNRVERERDELEIKKNDNKQESKNDKPVVIPVNTGSNENRKQKLDEISLLPQDNFGLIMVNSGMNII